jgi:hypothetical protein
MMLGSGRIWIVDTPHKKREDERRIAALECHWLLLSVNFGSWNGEPVPQVLIHVIRENNQRHRRRFFPRSEGVLSHLVAQFALPFYGFAKEPWTIVRVLQEQLRVERYSGSHRFSDVLYVGPEGDSSLAVFGELETRICRNVNGQPSALGLLQLLLRCSGLLFHLKKYIDRYPSVDNDSEEGPGIKHNFPQWRFMIAALAGISWTTIGWRNLRRVQRELVSGRIFLAGLLLRSYPVFGVLNWRATL